MILARSGPVAPDAQETRFRASVGYRVQVLFSFAIADGHSLPTRSYIDAGKQLCIQVQPDLWSFELSSFFFEILSWLELRVC